MKTQFIYAKSSIGKVEFDTAGLPSKIGIVTTIQLLHEMKKVVDYLWKKEIKAVVAGQVLGCDAGVAEGIKEDVDAFLYVGTGEFHPIGVALKTGKPVFVLNPDSMKLRKINDDEIEAIRKKKKAMLSKFHNSTVIGVLLTTKKGQSTVQGGMAKAQEIEKKYPDKKFYYFLCDTLDFSELENFNFIECWLNTMCPRVMEDINVLNVEEL